MAAYHIALFLHIVTLIVAAGATAVTKLAVARRIRARTVAEALDWHNVLISTSKLFPICLALFFVSGAYMVTVLGAPAWQSGFVVAGLVGVALLLASGTYLGIKGKALTQILVKIAGQDPDAAAPRMAPLPLVAMLPTINTGIALAVVFDMVTKPTTLASLAVIALGIGIGAAMAWRALSEAAQARTVVRPVSVPNEAST